MLTSEDIKGFCRSIDIDLVGVTDAQPFTKWRKEMGLGLKNGWVRVPPSMLPNDDDVYRGLGRPRALPALRSVHHRHRDQVSDSRSWKGGR